MKKGDMGLSKRDCMVLCFIISAMIYKTCRISTVNRGVLLRSRLSKRETRGFVFGLGVGYAAGLSARCLACGILPSASGMNSVCPARERCNTSFEIVIMVLVLESSWERCSWSWAYRYLRSNLKISPDLPWCQSKTFIKKSPRRHVSDKDLAGGSKVLTH